MRVSAMRTRLALIMITVLAMIGGALLTVIIWAFAQLWLLRTVGIPGPIDIGFGIP